MATVRGDGQRREPKGGVNGLKQVAGVYTISSRSPDSDLSVKDGCLDERMRCDQASAVERETYCRGQRA